MIGIIQEKSAFINLTLYKHIMESTNSSDKEKRRPPLSEVLSLSSDKEVFAARNIEFMLDGEQGLFSEVQANILKGAKHKYTLYCFLSFNKGQERAIVEWIRKLPITSAGKQAEWEQKGFLQINIITLLFSFKGYEYFFTEEQVDGVIPVRGDDDIIAFRKGLAHRCPTAFEDLDNKDIEPHYRESVHALILIATNNDRLKAINDLKVSKRSQDSALEELKEFFMDQTSFKTEFGEVFFEIGLRNPEGAAGEAREWFGFRDGISNPRFFPSQASKREWGGHIEEASPLNVVLRRDRLSPNIYACGSFAVFLKLEQDVEAFDMLVSKLAKELSLDMELEDSTEIKKKAEAYIIGRYKDEYGRPLSCDPTLILPNGRIANNFNYENDPLGEHCPLQAHIRKANPRNSQDGKRIVRRGKIYGNKRSKEKGILFMSYQSSFHAFEDIINRGLYAYSHKNLNIGQDLLFAEYGGGAYQNDRKYKNIRGDLMGVRLRTDKKPVTFRGGLYLFAPSISFIRESLLPI